MKRMNVTISANQYERMATDGLNASGLIRSLLDDHFSDEKIVFSVSADVKRAYEQVVSNFGGDDREIETFFRQALDNYLAHKTQQIDTLRQSLTAVRSTESDNNDN